MKNAFQLSIKEPCAQKFDSFTKTTFGGFCESCSKEVIDFTGISQKEIISYFSTANTNTCGRLNKVQLSVNEPKEINNMNTNFVSKGIAIFGFSLLALCAIPELNAQTSTETNSILKPTTPMVVGRIAVASQNQESYTVKGKVLDEEKLPLAGVNVVLKGSTVGVQTDFDGKFEFPRTLDMDDTLVFSYIGYEKKEYTITAEEPSSIDITINFDASDIFLMGEVVVDGVYESKPNIFQKFISIFK
jgi:hypothetical protein